MTTTHELPAELTDHLDEIRALCERYRVRALYVFGSAVLGTFDPATSDLDFVVDLGVYEPGVAGRLFDFTDAIRIAVGRDVDVITTGSRGNRRFLDEVNATRIPVYGA